MADLLALWSCLLATALYGALALFQLRRRQDDRLGRPLITAFAVVAVWAIFLGLLPPYNGLTELAESARNLAFLAFMHGILREAEDGETRRGLQVVFAAVAATIGLQIVVGGVVQGFGAAPAVFEALVSTLQLLGLVIAAGGLILVHNVYGQASPASRGGLRYPMLALAGMWAFDLHFYAVGCFLGPAGGDLSHLRGLVLALLAPLFALGLRNDPRWKVRISRAATFQSVSVIVILLYLVVMMSAARALELVGGDWVRAAQIGIVAAMTLAALVLLPSARARGWLRVMLAKHVFEHRYDYRREWLRFTDTVGRRGEGDATLEERVVKALADIGGAPAGLLLLADGGRLAPGAAWNWDAVPTPDPDDDGGALIRFIEADAYVVDFDAARRGESKAPVPAWLLGEARAWAGVPLVHSGRVVGLVLLAHPPYRRPLDWEDFDLFRNAGIQAASYIAEARGQQALADAARFDEFNRRFAFILHDIKNVVSQLSLVARNAERHADNPEFRADMIATLQASVKKMNDLLARLTPGTQRGSEAPRPVRVLGLVERVAAAKRRAHPVLVGGAAHLAATASPAALEDALAHLVQNAIDASDPAEPVRIRVFESGGDVAIEVADRGCGMSPAFVASRLFQPFASTKETGFGIGAYEARTLVTAMGGRLDVESAEGEGTSFTLFLPGAAPIAAPQLERMRA